MNSILRHGNGMVSGEIPEQGFLWPTETPLPWSRFNYEVL